DGARVRRHPDEPKGRRSGRPVIDAHRHRRRRRRVRAAARARAEGVRAPGLARSRARRGAQGMSNLIPLIAAVPLLAATVIALGGTGGDILQYWFGGWKPKSGSFPVGIGWAVDSIGASFALFVLVLLLSALVYSWRYMQDERYLYVVLMLAFGAAMAAFVLS